LRQTPTTRLRFQHLSYELRGTFFNLGAKAAQRAKLPMLMNTGEGHLSPEGGGDIIFNRHCEHGVRDNDGKPFDDKLREIAARSGQDV
jgi:hypothetical protein